MKYDVFMGEAWCLGDPGCAMTLVSSVFPASVSHFPKWEWYWWLHLGSSGKPAATSCGTEQQRNWVKYSSFPTQGREQPFPLSTGFCAESTSKAVAGTHNRGQFTRDFAVHSITMLGTGEAPDPTLLLHRANLGVQDRWEDKKDKASLALPRTRESLSRFVKQHGLAAFSLQNIRLVWKGTSVHIPQGRIYLARAFKSVFLEEGQQKAETPWYYGSTLLPGRGSGLCVRISTKILCRKHPYPCAACGTYGRSEAMVWVQEDKAASTVFPAPANGLDCSCSARGLLGCSRQKRPSVQMGKTLQ